MAAGPREPRLASWHPRGPDSALRAPPSGSGNRPRGAGAGGCRGCRGCRGGPGSGQALSPGPRSPVASSPARAPAHRHGRRVEREALVVVVPGPVQGVLELRPRAALGLADPLLALVVHPGEPRRPPPARPRPPRNAPRAGPAPLKPPSRKFTPQPPPEPRPRPAAAVLPAPHDLSRPAIGPGASGPRPRTYRLAAMLGRSGGAGGQIPSQSPPARVTSGGAPHRAACFRLLVRVGLARCQAAAGSP